MYISEMKKYITFTSQISLKKKENRFMSFGNKSSGFISQMFFRHKSYSTNIKRSCQIKYALNIRYGDAKRMLWEYIELSAPRIDEKSRTNVCKSPTRKYFIISDWLVKALFVAVLRKSHDSIFFFCLYKIIQEQKFRNRFWNTF